jgi:hypothetical protein
MVATMDDERREQLTARAVALVKEHFECVNRGDLEGARAPLFFPATMDSRPVDVYLAGMARTAPFT